MTYTVMLKLIYEGLRSDEYEMLVMQHVLMFELQLNL